MDILVTEDLKNKTKKEIEAVEEALNDVKDHLKKGEDPKKDGPVHINTLKMDAKKLKEAGEKLEEKILSIINGSKK